MSAGDDPAAGEFGARLLAWFDRHGRHDLPWQQPRTPYRVWLSEVMLQQTQVATAIPYFERFVARFPDLASLAAATPDAVLAQWAGLGYYSRARNLHRAARLVLERHGGVLPDDHAALLALPGIGRSTAGAILAQAYGQRWPILDGNVRRVLCRLDAIEHWPGLPAVTARLWQRATDLLPQTRLADYTQAQMDLGATVCVARRPRCLACPVQMQCAAFARGRTEQIPAPRPRRERALRERHWLLLEDRAGRILLERRPPSGIWGGLWMLPEGDSIEALLQRFGLQPGQAEAWTTVQHGFTHFELQARVWRTTAAELPDQALREAPAESWLDHAGLAGIGLPAPLRRLLSTR